MPLDPMRQAATSNAKLAQTFSEGFPQCLFPNGYLLLPGLREIYELQLARLEASALTAAQLIDQAAYFCSIDGTPTRHFITCTGETLRLPEYSSGRLKSFFANNCFRTGYATHGLFPYRGKFHPQMARGILNAMGMGKGCIVLDPMMGSGTTLVEAAAMGVDCIGLDASPFCVFMTETKVSALTMSLARVKSALQKVDSTFAYLAKRYGAPRVGVGPASLTDSDFARVMEEAEEYVVSGRRFRDKDTADTYALLLLAFLDTMGYVERSARKNSVELFRGILERYIHACDKFQAVRIAHNFCLGEVIVKLGDARGMDIPNASVDGILFSPPYSFAIDYVANDAFHLKALGVDTGALRDKMIGIRGGPQLAEKYACYVDDMRRVLRECHRVLRSDRYCTIVIGTNSNQLSKVLGTSPAQLTGLHEIVRKEAEGIGFSFVTEIERAITGISNTMREELIVFLRKS
jgi:hypothetical protein